MSLRSCSRAIVTYHMARRGTQPYVAESPRSAPERSWFYLSPHDGRLYSLLNDFWVNLQSDVPGQNLAARIPSVVLPVYLKSR